MGKKEEQTPPSSHFRHAPPRGQSSLLTLDRRRRPPRAVLSATTHRDSRRSRSWRRESLPNRKALACESFQGRRRSRDDGDSRGEVIASKQHQAKQHDPWGPQPVAPCRSGHRVEPERQREEGTYGNQINANKQCDRRARIESGRNHRSIRLFALEGNTDTQSRPKQRFQILVGRPKTRASGVARMDDVTLVIPAADTVGVADQNLLGFPVRARLSGWEQKETGGSSK